jgi:flagellar motor switch protein FliG
MDSKRLPGSLKVAILLQSLGREVSGQILASLTNSERTLVEGHLSQMGTVAPELVEKVAKEFLEMAGGRVVPQIGAGRNPMERAPKHLDEGSQPSGLKALQSLEPDDLFDLIRSEHPQILAVILVHLNVEAASQILARLPEDIRSDVALRIASLEKVSSEMIEEINRVFEGVLKDEESSKTHTTGGIGSLAEMLNQMDGTAAQAICEGVEESDPELASKIRQQMYVFDDLIQLIDDRGLQNFLRNVQTQELAMALKAAREDVKEKIFGNMSERAAAMLREEIESMGPVRVKEVEDAQQMISKIIQDMEQKGELIIRGRGGEQFI